MKSFIADKDYCFSNLVRLETPDSSRLDRLSPIALLSQSARLREAKLDQTNVDAQSRGTNRDSREPVGRRENGEMWSII